MSALPLCGGAFLFMGVNIDSPAILGENPELCIRNKKQRWKEQKDTAPKQIPRQVVDREFLSILTPLEPP